MSDTVQGKVLVLRGEEVVSVHQSPLDAYLAAQRLYSPGTFMIQPCEPGPDAYSVTLSFARDGTDAGDTIAAAVPYAASVSWA